MVVTVEYKGQAEVPAGREEVVDGLVCVVVFKGDAGVDGRGQADCEVVAEAREGRGLVAVRVA